MARPPVAAVRGISDDRASRRNGSAPLGRVATRRTSLAIPDGMTIDDWERIGRHIFVLSDSSGWWLGDWLIYGQDNYPDRYKRAIEETSLDYQTLRNYAWVARKFGPGRRRENLSLQHHAEVAGLSAGEQEQWLAQAEAGRWSRNELRRRIRARPHGETAPVTYVQMNVIPVRKQQWQQAAENTGMNLAEWIGATLDDAARRVLTDAQEGFEIKSGNTAA